MAKVLGRFWESQGEAFWSDNMSRMYAEFPGIMYGSVFVRRRVRGMVMVTCLLHLTVVV